MDGKSDVCEIFYPRGRREVILCLPAHLQYSSRRWLLYWQHEYVGKNYNAEVGYVPRNAYIKVNPQAGYTFFPKSGIFYHMAQNSFILYI